MKQRVHEMGQIALALAQQGDGENLIRVRKAFLRLMNTGLGKWKTRPWLVVVDGL